MTEREQAPRTPQDPPEWTGDDPPDRWPVRQPQLSDDSPLPALQDAAPLPPDDAPPRPAHDDPPRAAHDDLDRVPVPPLEDVPGEEPELPPAPDSIAEP